MSNGYKNFEKGIGLVPNATTQNATPGDLEVLSDNRLHLFGASTNDTVTTDAVSATLTNKTLTAPVIGTIVNTGTLTLPTSTDTLVGRATTDTLTNKSIDGNNNTITNIPNSALSATVVTTTGTQTLTNKTLTAPIISTISNSGTLTLPTGPDTLVGRSTTDTLTNKTLTNPIINGGSFDTITGEAGIPLLVQSVAGQQLQLNAGTASTLVEQVGGSTISTTASTGVTLATGKTLTLTNNTKTVSVSASSSASANYTITFPDAAPAANTALTYNGSNYLWTSTAAATLYTPNFQSFTATGAGTYGNSYWFTVTSANATVGAVYTNNAQTFTVARTISGATLLLCTSSGAPTASGTLTKSSGTGDSTITFSAIKAPLYLKIRAVGGGAGAGGGGIAGTGGTGGAGGNTTFGSVISCLGAAGGAAAGSNSGGSASITSPAIGLAMTGSGGGGWFATNAAGSAFGTGGIGGSSVFGQPGLGIANGAGLAAGVNSGSGGAGGGFTAGAVGSSYAAPGGGAGGYVEAIVYSPSATYSLSVGNGGGGGTAGTSGFAGGGGGSGYIEVIEFFQ